MNPKDISAGSWSFFPAVSGKNKLSPSLTPDVCFCYRTVSNMQKVAPQTTMSLGLPAKRAARAALPISEPLRKNSDTKSWSQRARRSCSKLLLAAMSMQLSALPASMFSKKRSIRSCSRESPAWLFHCFPVTAGIPVSMKTGLSKW